MNQLNAIGNLGADPETRYTKTGKAVSSFRIAIKSGWGDNEKTSWLNCVVWGRDDKPHGLIQYLQKGTKVAVTGPITLREYQRQDGTTSHSLDVTVSDFQPLSGQRDPSEMPESKAPEQISPVTADDAFIDDDMIPF